MRPVAWKILVIDDQIGRESDDRAEFLERSGRTVDEFVFCSGQDGDRRNRVDFVADEVRALWDGSPDNHLSLILLDIRFDDPKDVGGGARFGFTLLRELRERFGRALPVVMLTGVGEARGQANAAEADGFLPKEELSPQTLHAQIFRNAIFPETEVGVSGQTSAFLLTLRDIRRAVASRVMWEFLVLGESGTGKSELARYIHRVSNRTGDVATWFARTVNIDLHYDNLFGHWKGAFTGAGEHRAGLAEKAHNGTLFIDEIAELAPATQTAFLEYRDRHHDGFRRVHRLGNTPSAARRGDNGSLDIHGTYSPAEDRILVDTAMVCATNKPIDEESWRRETGFRSDFFSSLGLRITLPPLRERQSDIVPLFLKFAEKTAGRPIRLAEDARSALESHEWREGNIRELKKVAGQSLAQLGPDFDEVRLHHIDKALAAATQHIEPSRSAPESAPGLETKRLTQESGSFVDIEVRSLGSLAELLRAAVLKTRRPTGLGSLADILKHTTGVEYPATDVKREVRSILGVWFAPNARQLARWEAHVDYIRQAERIRRDEVLSHLYRYSVDETTWDDARAAIMEGLEK